MLPTSLDIPVVGFVTCPNGDETSWLIFPSAKALDHWDSFTMAHVTRQSLGPPGQKMWAHLSNPNNQLEGNTWSANISDGGILMLYKLYGYGLCKGKTHPKISHPHKDQESLHLAPPTWPACALKTQGQPEPKRLASPIFIGGLICFTIKWP